MSFYNAISYLKEKSKCMLGEATEIECVFAVIDGGRQYGYNT